MFMKKAIIIVVALVVVGAGAYYLTQNSTYKANQGANGDTTAPTDTSNRMPKNNDKSSEDSQTKEQDKKGETSSVIGTSVEGRDIKAHTYGNGDTKILFVGGIHGGYEWNTALLAYRAMDYFKSNKEVIPDNVEVTVIPVLNPDGLKKVIGTTGRFEKSSVPASIDKTVPGRFNGNGVDLNRNFDCEWQEEGKWRQTTVDGGDKPFSEPESQAIKNYVETNNPDAAVVWYSAAGGVFSSSCHNGILEETKNLTNGYAKAAEYPAHKKFDFYKITGDMVNWFAKKEIPAISVLLSDHESIEWSKNKEGIKAVLNYYSK